MEAPPQRKIDVTVLAADLNRARYSVAFALASKCFWWMSGVALVWGRNLLRRVIEVKPIPWWDQWGMNALLNDEVCLLKPKLQNTCMNIGMCMHYIMHAYILCMQYVHL